MDYQSTRGFIPRLYTTTNMPRRPAARSQARAKSAGTTFQTGVESSSDELDGQLGRGRWAWISAGLGGLTALIVLAWVSGRGSESPARLRANAESAARDGDWNTALRSWRMINASAGASSATYLGEARACLALSRAAQAERSLRRAIDADPTDPEPLLLLLKILRFEDRTIESQRLVWGACERVQPEVRHKLLRELTLGLLADLPDDLVRTTLRRWIDADHADIDARIALLQRIATQPRVIDPDRMARLAELETLLADHPEHVAVRDALVTTLADAGNPEQGRTLLNSWPLAARDARYWRLQGRWDLEYDHRPSEAVLAFQKALAELPQDWRSWYRLARALQIIGRVDESREAAETVSRIREVLDPFSLGPRLDAAFNRLDDSASLHELDILCTRAGLFRLARAWRIEAENAKSSRSSPL
jgi:tetratricopeptide (TPR) repeat protein